MNLIIFFTVKNIFFNLKNGLEYAWIYSMHQFKIEHFNRISFLRRCKFEFVTLVIRLLAYSNFRFVKLYNDLWMKFET